ncbi:MAG: porin family protein [Pseudolabrys sp.]|nr:porin family protein [Pseudolabrys sp.]MBV9261614.1 porin family protein [Pseudolabrys sp.]
MAVWRLRWFAAALLPVCLGTNALAADYPQPVCYDYATIQAGRAPPGAVPCYVPPPPVIVEEFSGWYLRGDIGFSNQQVKSLSNPLFDTVSFQAAGYGFDSAGIFGLGAGYYFNDWLRFDLTGEYRSRSNFHGLEIYSPTGAPSFTDEYHASKSEWLFLANAYVDLGTWWSITPFVGAGIGTARITIHNFTDICTTCAGGGVALADDTSKWNFAWALHAGLAYKVSKNFLVELSYRYVDMGDGVTGDIRDYLGNNTVFNPTTFKHLTSHDIRLGVRFNLDSLFERSCCTAPVYSPPVYAPPPVYSPPVYAPPALRSRG